MKNYIIIICLLLIIVFLPIAFYKEIEFDIAEFFTQYYIFLANAILLVLFGYFINSKLESLKISYRIKEKKNKLFNDLEQIILGLEKGENINDMIQLWNSSQSHITEIDIDLFLISTDFNKNSRFISSIKSSNFESKNKVPEFNESLKFLKQLKKAIGNELH